MATPGRTHRNATVTVAMHTGTHAHSRNSEQVPPGLGGGRVLRLWVGLIRKIAGRTFDTLRGEARPIDSPHGTWGTANFATAHVLRGIGSQ